MAWLGEPMLDTYQGAFTVERMLAGGTLVLANESAGELAIVVDQPLLDLHCRSDGQSTHEVGAAGLALVGVDAHVDPVRGAVDRHEQVASRRLVDPLRQAT